MKSGKVGAEDLRLAAEWLSSYEDHIDDEADPNSPGARCARVAHWLLIEASKREAAARDRASLRAAAEQVGISVAEAQRRVRSYRDTGDTR